MAERKIGNHIKGLASDSPHKSVPLIVKKNDSNNTQSNTIIKNYSVTQKAPVQSSDKLKNPYEKSFNKPRAVMCHIW